MPWVRAVRYLAALCLVIPASVVTWTVAGPATATTGVTCSVFNIAVAGTGTMSGCTDKANTGGSGTFKANLAKSPYSATATWHGTGTTTASVTYSSPTASICPKGDTEIVIKGTVTGGTKAAIKSIPKKSTVSANECYNPNQKNKALALTLAKGQLLHILPYTGPPPSPILHYGSLNGPKITSSDVLTATVAGFSGAITCGSGSLNAQDITNPDRPGTAKLNLTALSFQNCSVNVPGFGTVPLTFGYTPTSPMTISDSTGLPLNITGMNFSFTASSFPGASCSYTGTATGTYSDATNSASVTYDSGPGTGGVPGVFSCPSGSFNLTFGPFHVNNITGNPVLFVR